MDFWSTIGDVRKCTDEEHITYSGGSKNQRFGTMRLRGEKMKREKRENVIMIVCEIMILLKIDIFHHF